MFPFRDLIDNAPSPVEVYSDLLDPKHLPLLHGLVAVMILGSVALSSLVLASAGEDRWRLIPAICIGVLGVGTLFVHRLQGTLPAIRLFIYGGWLLVTATAFFGEGMRAPILMTHTVILIFSGWILGTRACAKLFAATAASIVLMAISRSAGWIHDAKPAGDGVVMLAHLVILSLAVIQTLYLVRLFGQRHAEEARLSAEVRTHLENVELRERYQRALLDNFPFMVWLKDENGRFLAGNRALAAALGQASPDALPGKTIFELASPELAASHAAEDSAVAADGRPRSIDQAVMLDGNERWFESYRAPVTVDGRVIGSVGFARDITERRQNDIELERHRHHLAGLVEERTAALSIAKEAAETASRAKTTFLANMSHELRTPLNAMIGMTALARARAIDPSQIDFLAKADRASRQLLAIIDDVLDISRIEAERLSIESTNFRLGKVISDVVDMTEPRIREKGLRLELGVDPEIAALVLRGDPMRLGQVLLNLASNAVKFTSSGAIGLRILRLPDKGSHVALRFEVEDTGIGVAPADRDRIFRAFEQADTSLTRRYGGTGLGLAISKRLVEAMGGTIGVESEPGTGSCFWFSVEFPRVAAVVERDDVSPEEMLAHCHGAEVLLVEDEPLNQAVTREVLESHGMQVDLAADGRQAVDMARAKRYDLILMDLQMPVMNGLDAAKEILRQGGPDRPAIIATTANAFDEDRRRSLDAGMDDFLAKPFTPEQILAVAARNLARHSRAGTD